MGYTKDAVKGISWITLLRGVTRLFTFIRLAILGRLLTPTQFGYFGIASLLLSILEIITETGINVFLIQEKAHIKEYINSAWVVSIIRGFIVGLLIVISSPFIAKFFNAQDAVVIIAVIGVVPIIRGFINPAVVNYQKDLLFRKEFHFRSILFFADVFISIIAGFLTKSAISFDYGLVASAILELILSYYLFSLKPNLDLEYHKVLHVISRGWWLSITGVFSYFADNGDNIAVGKLLGSSSLGIYQVAYKFSTLPISEITNVFNSVTFPVYSRFSEDKNRLIRAFLKVNLISSTAATFTGIIIFVFAGPLINLFMGNQWVLAIPAIKILAIYGIIRTFFGNFSSLFFSLHKQNYVAIMTAFRVLGLLVVIIPLVSLQGMVGAGYAMLISIFTEIPIILYFSYKLIKK